MRTYRINFIRHGLTDANADGRYIGSTDLPLSEAGRKELAALKEEGFYYNSELLFTSPLLRCTETCELLFPGTEPETIDELREYDFGEFENKTAYELENLPEYTAWTSGKVPCPPGGESTEEFSKRLCLGLNKMVRRMMEKEVYEANAVMHGGAIMTLFAVCAIPQKRMVEWTCPAGNGYTVRITPSLYGRSGIIEVIDTLPSTAEYLADDYV